MADARNLALKRLSIREYSSAEMRAYLKRKGISQAEAEPLVEKLVADGLIDDLRYARAVVRSQGMRGKGPMHILMKLKQKGVRLEIGRVKQLYQEDVQEDETQTISELIARKYPRAATDLKQRQRAYQALLRRGFSPDAIRRSLKGIDREED